VLRAALERSKIRAAQAAVICAGLVVELGFFFAPTNGRYIGIAPSLLGAVVLVKHVIVPLFPPKLASASIEGLSHSFSETGGPLWPLVIVVSLFAGAFAVAARYPRQSPLWLLCSGMVIALASYAGALDHKVLMLMLLPGGRYAFAPQALFGLAVLSWSVIARYGARILARGLVVWLIVIGLAQYFPAASQLLQTGPPWRAEVRKWQQDPAYALKIWPSDQPGWAITLHPQ